MIQNEILMDVNIIIEDIQSKLFGDEVVNHIVENFPFELDKSIQNDLKRKYDKDIESICRLIQNVALTKRLLEKGNN